MSGRVYAVIMSGGVGTRFWPLSREKKPKQFLSMGLGKSFLRETFERIVPVIPKERVFIVTGRKYESLIRCELPEIPPDNILLEPVGKNTAPCIGYASAVISRIDEGASIVVLPCDHFVKEVDRFREVVKMAVDFAVDMEAILTVGITPEHPETGYGYIHTTETVTSPSGGCALRVDSFTEKPDYETAKRFLEEGDYYWNAGIFISPVGKMLESIATHMPDMHRALEKLSRGLGTDREEECLNDFFRNVEPVSIDYGVMEKEEHVFMIEGNYGWSDVGSWQSAYELIDTDGDGNAVFRGDLLSIDSQGCYVDAQGKLVVMIGVKDLIAVSTDDAILLCERKSSQRVREAVNLLKVKGRTDLL
ncbi:MAG: mannose-1-phosphate guanylyltransferase [Candidatus Glassbacteria bacterium]